MPFRFMKLVVGLALAALATSALFAAPGTVDTSKRAIETSTEDKKAVLPDNKPIERNDVVSERRFENGTEVRTKENATVGETRSNIKVGEEKDKAIYPSPERKEYEVIERKDSKFNSKEGRFSTSEDAYRSKTAVRFQEKIGDASPITGEVTTTYSRRTTFDRINRFAFRKNGDQRVRVNAAGAEREAGDISDRSSVSISEPKVSVMNGMMPKP